MRPITPGGKRVVESHDIARRAFVAALGFAALAAVWTVLVLVAGGSWWGPLHSFLAGTVLLAISGATQMFTITWSSTVPPSRGAVLIQRCLLVGGVGLVLVGVARGLPVLVWLGGAAALAGLVSLAWLIVAAVRKSLLRRFDLSARFYLTGFAAGALGIILGTMMGAGATSFSTIRLVHAHLNLVGLVGLVIIGTIPTLLPTTAHSRAVSGGEAVLAWWMALVGAICVALGLWVPALVGVGTIAIAVAGASILGGILGRLWGKGRHKLPFLQIGSGTVWLIAWALFEGVSVATSGTMTQFGRWTGAVVLAGVGQVLAGSLAYLVPVLRGSPFVANREIMEARSWLPLLTLNSAGLSLGLGFGLGAVVLCAVWIFDFAVRLARVALARSSDFSPPEGQ